MKFEDYELNEFGTRFLVKAINNCSDEFQDELKAELRKLVRT